MKKNLLFMALAAMTFTAMVFTGCTNDDPDPVKVSSVAFKATPSASLEVGDTYTFEAVVLPENAENKSVTWDSSNKSVATVSGGVVTTLAAGTTTISATANDGSGKKAEFEITVTPDTDSYTVSISGDGYDIAEQMEILESEAGTRPVKVNVAATGGIDKLLIEITSSSMTFNGALVGMGFDANSDLANPAGLLAGSLTSLEGLLPFGDAVKNKTTLPFDITNFIPMIFMVTAEEGGDVTAEFKLTVHDAYNHSDSKVLKLKLIRDSQLPNGGFESWSFDTFSTGSLNGVPRTYFPYDHTDITTRFWDTANKGLTMGADAEDRNLTVSSEDVRPGSAGTKSALMTSRNVTILVMSKFAAGNLFTGEFGSLNLAKGGATVYFGQPFSFRPAALNGWFKANAGTITHAGEGSPKGVGDPDEYQIFVALTTWDEPHKLDTWDPTTFLNPAADSGIIGFGEKSGTGAVADWTEFNIPITYTSDATPTHIVVVATSSKYGDFFTGSTDSWLQVDDFKLVYNE